MFVHKLIILLFALAQLILETNQDKLASSKIPTLCYDASFKPIFKDGSFKFTNCIFTTYAVEEMKIQDKPHALHNPNCESKNICAAACLNNMCLSYELSQKLYNLKYRWLLKFCVIILTYLLMALSVIGRFILLHKKQLYGNNYRYYSTLEAAMIDTEDSEQSKNNSTEYLIDFDENVVENTRLKSIRL